MAVFVLVRVAEAVAVGVTEGVAVFSIVGEVDGVAVGVGAPSLDRVKRPRLFSPPCVNHTVLPVMIPIPSGAAPATRGYSVKVCVDGSKEATLSAMFSTNHSRPLAPMRSPLGAAPAVGNANSLTSLVAGLSRPMALPRASVNQTVPPESTTREVG